MENSVNGLARQMAVFRRCEELERQERRLRLRQIYMKERRSILSVIMKPAEYMKYINGIRESLRNKARQDGTADGK